MFEEFDIVFCDLIYPISLFLYLVLKVFQTKTSNTLPATYLLFKIMPEAEQEREESVTSVVPWDLSVAVVGGTVG